MSSYGVSKSSGLLGYKNTQIRREYFNLYGTVAIDCYNHAFVLELAWSLKPDRLVRVHEIQKKR